jgi:hypothetical protein
VVIRGNRSTVVVGEPDGAWHEQGRGSASLAEPR